LNLIIDIGNTRTKVGVFSGEKLLKKGVLEKEWSIGSLDQWLGKREIKNVAISTTAGIDEKIEQELANRYYYLRLSHKTALPIRNSYKTPETLGRDRLAVAVAATDIFPKKNCLIIDAGTCITYDFIDKNKIYIGGSITPGVEMRLKAMNAFTANLPLVARKKLSATIGNDTVTSIRTGAQHGATVEMEGNIRHYKALFGRLQVLLTGGDAKYFAENLKTQLFVNQNLVLIGLNKILNYNVQLLGKI
jgi:type III pantothenate kinase